MSEQSPFYPFRGTVAYPTGPDGQRNKQTVRGGGSIRAILVRAGAQLRDGGRITLHCRGVAEAERCLNAWDHMQRSGVMPSLAEGAVQRVFGAYDFGQTVGLWLASGQSTAADLLSPFISTEGFSFTPEEFLNLKERLRAAKRRYERLPRVSPALEELNTGFFRHQTLEESEAFIRQRLREYLAIGAALHRDYLLAIHAHGRRQLFLLRTRWQEQKDALEKLTDQLSRTADWHRKKASGEQKRLIPTWEAYRTAYREDLPVLPGLSHAEATDLLVREKKQLLERRAQLPRSSRAESLALSPLTADPALVDPEDLRRLAGRLEDLVRKIDEAGLYQLPLRGGAAATSPRQLQRLENIMARLRKTLSYLPGYADFFAHRQFWYQQPAHLRRLLAPLLELPTADWEPAFSAWYFEHCLLRAEPPGQHPQASTSATVAVKPALPLLDRNWKANVRVVTAAEVPAPREVGELLVDFTATDPPVSWKDNPTVSWAPLHHPSATPYALAGEFSAAQAMNQFFTAVRPPAWAAVRVDQPPPASAGQLSFQLGDRADWQPLESWKREAGEHLHLYLPETLGAEQGQLLCREWEHLMVAAPRFTLFHAWTNERITQSLLSDGFNPDFLAAALLRAAEAADTGPFDREAFMAIGREIRTRCGLSDPPMHPLMEELLPIFQARLPGYFFELHLPWRDTFLPLLVTAPTGRKTVLLPDGNLPAGGGAIIQALRRQELVTAGFDCISISTEKVWVSTAVEMERVITALRSEAQRH